MRGDRLVVTSLHVVPIDDIHLAVRTIAEVEHLRCTVQGQQKVGTMAADESRTPRGKNVCVQALAMNVVHDDLIAVLLGPGTAQINHRPGMRVAAPCFTRLFIA